MVKFEELHSDGWGENTNFRYIRKNFELGGIRLGKLLQYSYKGRTKELLFGEDRSYDYSVLLNDDNTLKILDMKRTGWGEEIEGKDHVEDNFIQLSAGGKKNIRKTKRKMNKKKSKKRR
jgi:hypothetical protein